MPKPLRGRKRVSLVKVARELQFAAERQKRKRQMRDAEAARQEQRVRRAAPRRAAPRRAVAHAAARAQRKKQRRERASVSYSSDQRILLVGEGNFSFAVALGKVRAPPGSRARCAR
jgi:regulator of protease activity HflC (stomatin/prohibitin superfamily)